MACKTAWAGADAAGPLPARKHGCATKGVKMILTRSRGGSPRAAVVAALAAAGITICLALAGAAPARGDDSVILPPDSAPFGKSYGQWSAAWWQQMLPIPVPKNPLLDATGANCKRGDGGK